MRALLSRSIGDLVALEEEAGVPFLGFWDPLGFTKLDLFDFGESGTIGWLVRNATARERLKSFLCSISRALTRCLRARAARSATPS